MFRYFIVGAILMGAFVLVVAVLPSHAAQYFAPLQSNNLQTTASQVFEARLSGANEVPPVNTEASGRAVLVLDDTTNTLYYRVMVSEILTITAAHIHESAPGVNGPVIFPLYTGAGEFDPSNPISGTLPLSDDEVNSLANGDYYINVHTNANPGGEIRGQVEILTPGDLNAVLLGKHETPPAYTKASGVAQFSLNTDLDELSYEIHVRDIVTVTAAHIHPGRPGENNAPLFPLFPNGTNFDPDNPISGVVTLTNPAVNVLDLLSGFYYVNVHTEFFPGGEIRGQISDGYQAFDARLSGDKEVPQVDTEASGYAVMVLDNDMSTLYYRVTVSEIISVTAAHIHKGPPGVSGGVIFPLFTSGVFDPQNPISGTLSLSLSEVADLVSGNYYVNVHTTDNPNGEVRGQLGLHKPPRDYQAYLAGIDEVPPVETVATAHAQFRLDQPEKNMLHYEISVTGTISITAAHIHTGWPDENGPVVIPLYAGERPFDPLNPISGDVQFSAENLRDLLTGYLYVNIHTEDQPAGFIRGQIKQIFRLYLPLVARMTGE